MGARPFRIGSAAIVFAIAAVGWFWLAWSTLTKIDAPGATPETALRLSIGVTVPLVIVTAIALIARNVTQSEGQTWIISLVAFLVAAIGFAIWLSGWAVRFS
jgi:hypothetical protein